MLHCVMLTITVLADVPSQYYCLAWQFINKTKNWVFIDVIYLLGLLIHIKDTRNIHDKPAENHLSSSLQFNIFLQFVIVLTSLYLEKEFVLNISKHDQHKNKY